MSNQDVTTYKFAAVLNKKVDIGKLMNVLGHISICLVTKSTPEQIQAMGIINYKDKDDNAHEASRNSFIILKADNGNQIRSVRNAAIERGILFVDFTHTMQEGTYKDQLEKTKETSEKDLEYYGIVLFGEITEVTELTRKFQLWK